MAKWITPSLTPPGSSAYYSSESLAEHPMRGVKYLYNSKGKRTAVLIDLERNSSLWEDLLDVAVARTRKKEPTESWTVVRRRLERAGRLKPAR